MYLKATPKDGAMVRLESDDGTVIKTLRVAEVHCLIQSKDDLRAFILAVGMRKAVYLNIEVPSGSHRS